MVGSRASRSAGRGPEGTDPLPPLSRGAPLSLDADGPANGPPSPDGRHFPDSGPCSRPWMPLLQPWSPVPGAWTPSSPAAPPPSRASWSWRRAALDGHRRAPSDGPWRLTRAGPPRRSRSFSWPSPPPPGGREGWVPRRRWPIGGWSRPRWVQRGPRWSMISPPRGPLAIGPLPRSPVPTPVLDRNCAGPESNGNPGDRRRRAHEPSPTP